MTYDDAEGVRNLSSEFGFDIQQVAMQNSHLWTVNELVIGRNLNRNK